jgi:hypothetical protein
MIAMSSSVFFIKSSSGNEDNSGSLHPVFIDAIQSGTVSGIAGIAEWKV